MSSEPVTYNQFLYKTIPYDPERDFQPITGLFFNTLALVVNPETKVKTFAEMVALAKARPGKLSYATFAYPAAYFMGQLNKAEGTDIVRVPYRGGGEVVNALLSNTTPIAILALSNMVAQLESGRIVPLAVTGRSRSPLFSNVPTLAEVRPGAELAATWFGLFTQAGVPRPIVEKVAADADRIMAQPEFRKRIYTDRAVEPAMERLEAFADFIRKERVISGQIVKDSGEPPR